MSTPGSFSMMTFRFTSVIPQVCAPFPILLCKTLTETPIHPADYVSFRLDSTHTLGSLEEKKSNKSGLPSNHRFQIFHFILKNEEQSCELKNPTNEGICFWCREPNHGRFCFHEGFALERKKRKDILPKKRAIYNSSRSWDKLCKCRRQQIGRD